MTRNSANNPEIRIPTIVSLPQSALPAEENGNSGKIQAPREVPPEADALFDPRQDREWTKWGTG